MIQISIDDTISGYIVVLTDKISTITYPVSFIKGTLNSNDSWQHNLEKEGRY